MGSGCLGPAYRPLWGQCRSPCIYWGLRVPEDDSIWFCCFLLVGLVPGLLFRLMAGIFLFGQWSWQSTYRVSQTALSIVCCRSELSERLFFRSCSACWRVKGNVLTVPLNNPQAALHWVAYGNYPVCFVFMLNPETRPMGSNNQDFCRIKPAILGCVDGDFVPR